MDRLTTAATQRYYPENDGEPMGETDVHIDVIIYLRGPCATTSVMKRRCMWPGACCWTTKRGILLPAWRLMSSVYKGRPRGRGGPIDCGRRANHLLRFSRSPRGGLGL
jgi:hypothetical protein